LESLESEIISEYDGPVSFGEGHESLGDIKPIAIDFDYSFKSACLTIKLLLRGDEDV